MDDHNPFHRDAPQPPNPYATPHQQPGQSDWAPGKVMAPAIALLIVGILGLGFSIFNVVFALTQEPFVDPNAEEFVRQMQENAAGPVAATIQAVFALVNVFIIIGSIMMMRLKSWGVSLATSIVAMVNLGTCCCILGLPMGIWSVAILAQDDVRQLFARAAN